MQEAASPLWPHHLDRTSLPSEMCVLLVSAVSVIHSSIAVSATVSVTALFNRNMDIILLLTEPPRQGWVLYFCDLLLTTQQLSHNTLSIHKRNVDMHLQTTDAIKFDDDHYPGLYTSEMVA